MIRQATEQDAARILEMSRSFYVVTNYPKIGNLDDETVTELIHTLISDHMMLVAEVNGEVVGMAGLMVAPFIFNKHKRGSHEVVWFVHEDYQSNGIGKALLVAIEEHANLHECDMITMALLATSPPQAALAYEKAGYVISEITYIKVLN